MTRSHAVSPAGPATRPGVRRLAAWARRWAPWKVVMGALLVVAALHVLWALRIPWPTSSMTALADTVYGHRPFPSAAATWGVVALLLAAVGVVIGSMRRDLPESVARLLRVGALVIVGVLLLRGVGGEVASLTGIEGSNTRYRILDIVFYSPLCIWSALGIYFRQSAPDRAARR